MAGLGTLGIGRGLSGLVGFSKGLQKALGLLPPSGYIAWLQGGLAPGTEQEVADKKSVLTPFKYVNNNAKYFDGVTNSVNFPMAHTFGVGDYIEIDFEVLNTTANQTIVATRTGAAPWISLSATTSTYFHLQAQDGTNFESLGFPVSSTLDRVTIKIVGVSGGFEVFVDGVSGGTLMHPGGCFNIFGGTNTLKVSGWNTINDPAEMRVYYLKAVVEGSTKLGACFANGASETEYDISGNGNHGSYIGTISTMNVGHDDITAWNIKNGFSLYTHATLGNIYVPYVNGSPISSPSVPTGYSFDSNHPAGFVHNGAESKIICLDPTYFRTVVVSGLTGADAVDNGAYNYVDAVNGYPRLQHPTTSHSGYLYFDAGFNSWYLDGIYYNFTLNDYYNFPHPTDWEVGAGGTSPVLTYDDIFIEADYGSLAVLTPAEILANNADTDAVRSSYDANGNIVDILIYPAAPTGDELAQLNDYLDSKHTTVPNHKSLETTFMLYDEADGEYYPVGLDNGAFVVLQGSGQNYTADGTTFKLIDINDGLYYPVGLENGAFVVLQGSGQNYTSTIFEFDLIDIGDSQFKKVFLSNGSFAVE